MNESNARLSDADTASRIMVFNSLSLVFKAVFCSLEHHQHLLSTIYLKRTNKNQAQEQKQKQKHTKSQNQSPRNIHHEVTVRAIKFPCSLTSSDTIGKTWQKKKKKKSTTRAPPQMMQRREQYRRSPRPPSMPLFHRQKRAPWPPPPPTQ